MADDVRNIDGRSRSRKRPAGAPVMTNRAALRVLKDLASKKTWYMLGNELGFRVEDINKKNYPWPSDFGCNEYCAKFQEYAKSEHTSPYAALIAVRESLIESNAYTPEVKALVDNVRPDSDEAMCEAALRRLMETIIETALPYNKVPKPAREDVTGGPLSSREADGAEVRPTTAAVGETGTAGGQAASGEVGDAQGQAAEGETGDALGRTVACEALGPQGLAAVAGEGGDARGQAAAGVAQGAKSVASDDMAERAARVARGAQGHLVQAYPAAVPYPSGVAYGAQASLTQAAGETAQPALLCGNHNPSSHPWLGPETFLLDGRDRAQTLRAILPTDVFALAGGAGEPASPQTLVQRLCSDSGLACRAMQRACSALAANPGVDAARLFAEMDAAFGAAGQGGGDAGDKRLEALAPAAPGQSAPANTTTASGSRDPQLHRRLSQARTLFLRYADADAGRALLCCTLLNLLGAQGFVRVMTCPATRDLFAR